MANAEHDEIAALLPAYALGSLDAEEAAVVERHLAACEPCQAELAEYESVVGLMALAAPEATPSPALKGRLLAQTRPQAGLAAVSSPEPAGRSLGQRLADGLNSLISGPRWRPAVALLVLLLVAGNVLLWRQLQTSGTTTDGWQQVHLYASDAAPEATGFIYISDDGRNGTLVVDGLPVLAAEQQYQLWLIRDEVRDSGAVFSVNEDGYRGIEIASEIPLEAYSAFGITIEPAGGSPAPTGERVLGYSPQ